MSAMQEITSARGRKFRPETHARARMIAHRMIAHREVYFSIVAVLFYVQSPACAPPPYPNRRSRDWRKGGGIR